MIAHAPTICAHGCGAATPRPSAACKWGVLDWVPGPQSFDGDGHRECGVGRACEIIVYVDPLQYPDVLNCVAHIR